MPSGKSSEISSTLSKRYTVEKFTGNKYRMWKLRMNLILERVELLGILSGKLKRLTWERKRERMGKRMNLIIETIGSVFARTQLAQGEFAAGQQWRFHIISPIKPYDSFCWL